MSYIFPDWPHTIIYYILNKQIQEFLVKIKMLFLRSLQIFISSRDILEAERVSLEGQTREINLCRLDTFPTMVAKRSFMYNRYRRLDYFEFYSVCSCSYTQVPNRHELPLSIANKQIDAVRHWKKVISQLRLGYTLNEYRHKVGIQYSPNVAVVGLRL